MEGPICRYGQTADALLAGEPVTRPNLYAGSLRMLWGLAKKMIVADRLNAFVKPVFADYTSYDGTVIAVAAVLYTLQLYCDFSGTMDVALGMSPHLRHKSARELPPAVLLAHRLGILAALAHHFGHLAARLHLLPRLAFQTDEEADEQGAQTFRQPLRAAARLVGSSFVRMARQRPVARCGLAVHLLRYVLLRAHCGRQPHRSDGRPVWPSGCTSVASLWAIARSRLRVRS